MSIINRTIDERHDDLNSETIGFNVPATFQHIRRQVWYLNNTPPNDQVDTTETIARTAMDIIHSNQASDNDSTFTSNSTSTYRLIPNLDPINDRMDISESTSTRNTLRSKQASDVS